MWPELVVVSTPSLHFCAGVVKAHVPVRVQALRPELAIERLDEAVVGRLARPREVKNGALTIGPEVEITADELRALVDPDDFWITDTPTNALKGSNNILAPIAEPRIDGRREPRESIDNRQNAQLSPCSNLIMDEIHRPGLVDLHGGPAIFPQFRLLPTLGCLVPELQAHLLVRAIDSFRVHGPAVPLQQDMHATIPVADTG